MSSKVSRAVYSILAERDAKRRKAAATTMSVRSEASPVLLHLLVRIVTDLPMEAIANVVRFLPLAERSRLACVHRCFREAVRPTAPVRTASPLGRPFTGRCGAHCRAR